MGEYERDYEETHERPKDRQTNTLLGENDAKSMVLGNDVSQHGHVKGMEDGHGERLCGYEHKVHQGVVQ